MTDSQEIAKIAERSCVSFTQFYPMGASHVTMAPYQSIPGILGPTGLATRHYNRSHHCHHTTFLSPSRPPPWTLPRSVHLLSRQRKRFHTLYRKMIAGRFPQVAFLLYLHFFLSPFLFLFHFVNVTVLGGPGESERGSQLRPQLLPRLTARDSHCHASKVKSQGQMTPWVLSANAACS